MYINSYNIERSSVLMVIMDIFTNSRECIFVCVRRYVYIAIEIMIQGYSVLNDTHTEYGNIFLCVEITVGGSIM